MAVVKGYTKYVILGLLLLAGLIALYLTLQPKPIVIIRPVKTMEIQPIKTNSTHTFNGIAKSGSAARLSFKVSGTVKKVRARVGQRVKRGDLIATLDDSIYRLRVNEVKASLAQVNSELKHAKSQYKRIQKLYVNQNSSLSDLETSRTAYESAKAQYRAMKNRLEQAKLELSYTNLKAPINGAVSEINIRKGENIGVATPVAVISSTKSIDVPVYVPGALIDNIHEGDKCKVFFDAYKNKTYTANVVEVSRSSSGRTTTFLIKVRVIKPSKKVLPGMAASVTFKVKRDAHEGDFVVPLHAVLEDRNGHFIYTVENIKDGVGIIARKNIQVGDFDTNGMTIFGDVKKGWLVITAGMSQMKVNMKVKVPQAKDSKTKSTKEKS
jgi:RND family efflux transporter MFP subunit